MRRQLADALAAGHEEADRVRQALVQLDEVAPVDGLEVVDHHQRPEALERRTQRLDAALEVPAESLSERIRCPDDGVRRSAQQLDTGAGEPLGLEGRPEDDLERLVRVVEQVVGDFEGQRGLADPALAGKRHHGVPPALQGVRQHLHLLVAAEESRLVVLGQWEVVTDLVGSHRREVVRYPVRARPQGGQCRGGVHPPPRGELVEGGDDPLGVPGDERAGMGDAPPDRDDDVELRSQLAQLGGERRGQQVAVPIEQVVRRTQVEELDDGAAGVALQRATGARLLVPVADGLGLCHLGQDEAIEDFAHVSFEGIDQPVHLLASGNHALPPRVRPGRSASACRTRVRGCTRPSPQRAGECRPCGDSEAMSTGTSSAQAHPRGHANARSPVLRGARCQHKPVAHLPRT